MRPLIDINVGDKYVKSYPYDIEWEVIVKNEDYKMILIMPIFLTDDEPLNLRETWVKLSNTIFNNRIFKGEVIELIEEEI